MDDQSTAESTEPVQAAQSAPVDDLEQARAKVATLRTEMLSLEIAIAEGELHQAEGAHDKLLEQCDAAQHSFDELGRKVIAQQGAFYQASTRQDGAAQTIDMQRRNLPERRYGNKAALEAWSMELSRLEVEQETAKKEYGEVTAVLIGLQAERSAATNALESLSWPERRAGRLVAELRKRLAQMRPSDATPVPNQFGPILNGRTLDFSTDNSLRSDPVTRRASTGGDADSH